MKTITRAQLQQAIEEGITAASNLLEDADIEALREVGRTAKIVGPNFAGEYVCPATQAGIFRERADDRRDIEFAFAYDDALHEMGLSSVTVSTFKIV